MGRISLVVGLGAILIGASAWGLTQNLQCVANAAKQKVLCKQTCQEDFATAKDQCLNVDPVCANTCRTDRATRVAPTYAALQTCIDGCQATLDTAKANCRDMYPNDPEGRDTCIDQAQVVAFSCRDTCREGLDRSALKQCWKAFHQCMVACPPPATPTPAN
jgi:hypothetical protein